jgi:YggT family protein
MTVIIPLLIRLLDIYLWVIIATVVLSWLLVFNVINGNNIWVYRLRFVLDRLTTPVYRQLRRFVPPIGGIDLTPMIVIFAIYLLQNALFRMM